MPVIPTYNSRERLTTEVPTVRKSPQIEAQAGLTGAIGDVADIVTEVKQKFDKLRDVNQESDAKIFLAQQQAALTDKVSKEDIWKATDNLDNEIRRINEEAIKKISNPIARDRFRANVEIDGIAFKQHLTNEIRRKQIDQAKVNTYRDLDLEQSNYINAPDEAGKAASSQKMQEIIASQGDVFTKEQAYKLHEDSIKEAEEAIKDRQSLARRKAKEDRMAEEEAKEAREVELIKLKREKKTPVEELIKRGKEYGDAHPEREKFANAYVNALKSPKAVGAKTIDKDFSNILTGIREGVDPTAIRTELENLRTDAKLSDEDYTRAHTFLEAVTSKNVDDLVARKKKGGLFKLFNVAENNFDATQNKALAEASRARMNRRYIDKLNEGKDPDIATDEAIREEVLYVVSSAGKIPETGLQVMDARGRLKTIMPNGDLVLTEVKKK